MALSKTFLLLGLALAVVLLISSEVSSARELAEATHTQSAETDLEKTNYGTDNYGYGRDHGYGHGKGYGGGGHGKGYGGGGHGKGYGGGGHGKGYGGGGYGKGHGRGGHGGHPGHGAGVETEDGEN